MLETDSRHCAEFLGPLFFLRGFGPATSVGSLGYSFKSPFRDLLLRPPALAAVCGKSVLTTDEDLPVIPNRLL